MPRVAVPHRGCAAHRSTSDCDAFGCALCGSDLATCPGTMSAASGKVTARIPHETLDEPSSPHPRTILLVEDDPDIRDGMASVLRRFGYEVLIACNGLDAIRVLASADPPSLIVLDWMMPVMSGPELMER